MVRADRTNGGVGCGVLAPAGSRTSSGSAVARRDEGQPEDAYLVEWLGGAFTSPDAGALIGHKRWHSSALRVRRGASVVRPSGIAR